MKPYSLFCGDCIEVMRSMAENSVDSIVTDPPYHLTNNGGGPAGKGADNAYSRSRAGARSTGFMGQAWDGGDIAQRVELWVECLRVLKPGGHLLAFSGTRTQHRMVCAIEDAGFEVRDRKRYECSALTKYGALFDSLTPDQRGAVLELLNDQTGIGSELAWGYGSGFPKSRNIAGQDLTADDADKWAGWGTALKPAYEPICVARKPLAKDLTVAANVLQFGTGAINIDACRVAPTGESRVREGEASQDRRYTAIGGTNFAALPGVRGGDPIGRWPANIVHDGSAEVLALFPESASGAMRAGTLRAAQDGPGSVCYGTYGGNATAKDIESSTGSAARFFYCAKASRADRNEGLASSSTPAVETDATMRDCETADWSTRNGNHHPTVKPTDLMAYLCRLVTPPPWSSSRPIHGLWIDWKGLYA